MSVWIFNAEKPDHSKDLHVKVSSDVTLFDGIYEDKAVQDAHIRTWPKETVTKLRNGEYEVLIQIWNTETDKSHFIYTLDDLKETTTENLYRAAPTNEKGKVQSPICLKVTAKAWPDVDLAAEEAF